MLKKLYINEDGSYTGFSNNYSPKHFITQFDSNLVKQESKRFHHLPIGEWMDYKELLHINGKYVIFYIKDSYDLYCKVMDEGAMEVPDSSIFLTTFPKSPKGYPEFKILYDENRKKVVIFGLTKSEHKYFQRKYYISGESDISYVIVNDSQKVEKVVSNYHLSAEKNMAYDLKQVTLDSNDNVVLLQSKIPEKTGLQCYVYINRPRTEAEISTYRVVKIEQDTSYTYETEDYEYIYDLKMVMSKDSIYLVGLADYYEGDAEYFLLSATENYLYYNVLDTKELKPSNQESDKVFDQFYNFLTGCWLTKKGEVVFTAELQDSRTVTKTERDGSKYTVTTYYYRKAYVGVLNQTAIRDTVINRNFGCKFRIEGGPAFIETDKNTVVCFTERYVKIDNPDSFQINGYDVVRPVVTQRSPTGQARARAAAGTALGVSRYIRKISPNQCYHLRTPGSDTQITIFTFE